MLSRCLVRPPLELGQVVRGQHAVALVASENVHRGLQQGSGEGLEAGDGDHLQAVGQRVLRPRAARLAGHAQLLGEALVLDQVVAALGVGHLLQGERGDRARGAAVHAAGLAVARTGHGGDTGHLVANRLAQALVVYFVVMDGAGATSAEDASAGGMSWVVRNFLTMVAVHKPSYEHSSDSSVRVIGFSGTLATMMNSQRIPDVENLLSVSANSDQSILCEYNIPDGLYPRLFLPAQVAEASLEAQGLMEHMNVVGWETNERGKPGPRVADLTQTLDSAYIMSQAVDLNLRLMKWRLWPALDTDRLASNCKCLLLGAGTLGCAVARALLGWGVRDITFVDSGIVSYSNPARQCLFEYQDCVNRSYKAVAAAARLQKIFPGVRSRGVVMSIPMPGHPLHAASSSSPSDEEANYLQFVELVNSHDVIFTLTDSRESRWLPTLLCAANDKLLINAALGFDSYLVMRHGGSSGMVVNAGMKASTTLGCYFCNDVVAATNSQRDRSLDQQCTVTRPGLSFIAAALAVEMMVALFNPQAREVGEGEGEGEGDDTPDGDHAGLEVPHQIRGSLAGFTQMTPYSPAFSNCTACSKQVVDAFQHGVGQIEPGFNFIQHVCADSSVLESVSGIAELMDTIDLDQCVESDEDF
eukprot:CAMPEP_0173235138 /NCGR_PEP_ID=MMETSP1142-20121109/10663_1 /TAXON_ID=483371 /ORGANISM="non described non described, Strain CCMP2298" /LENGTH=641 /DNA_ID=CAMNT_0014165353 /DNA_START=168 /DNA_END=2094 /DNA_ORIENTATION=+